MSSLLHGVLRLASQNPNFRRRMIASLREKIGLVNLMSGDEMVIPGTSLLAHRSREGLRVKDMTNAGKRGKTVPNFYLEWGSMGPDPDFVTGIIGPILEANSYSDALRTAQELVDGIKGEKYPTQNDPESWGQDTYSLLELREGVERGIDLAPLGALIKGETPIFTYTSTPRDFSILMVKPPRGDQLGGWSRTPAHAKKIFEWLKVDGNMARLQAIPSFTKAVSFLKDETGQHLETK